MFYHKVQNPFCIILNFCDYDYYFLNSTITIHKGFRFKDTLHYFSMNLIHFLRNTIFNFSTACFLHAIQTVTNLNFLHCTIIEDQKSTDRKP